MAGRDVAMFETFSFPLAYSFWASIITRTLSEGEAVEGGIPTMFLKEGAVSGFIFGGLVRCKFGWSKGNKVKRRRLQFLYRCFDTVKRWELCTSSRCSEDLSRVEA